MARIIWIIIGVVGSKITNEILFEIFNSPTSGVSMTNAALPAIGSVAVLLYCFYMGFSGKSIFGLASPDTHVKCPDCRELVKKDASKCKYCGSSLIAQ